MNDTRRFCSDFLSRQPYTTPYRRSTLVEGKSLKSEAKSFHTAGRRLNYARNTIWGNLGRLKYCLGFKVLFFSNWQLPPNSHPLSALQLLCAQSDSFRVASVPHQRRQGGGTEKEERLSKCFLFLSLVSAKLESMGRRCKPTPRASRGWALTNDLMKYKY